VVGDIIQIVLNQTYALQQCQNVAFYRVEDTPTEGVLEGACLDFESDVGTVMKLAQNLGVAYTSIVATNIFSLDQFVYSPTTLGVGANVSGDYLSSFISGGIKLVRGNARVRHGRKSIVGMSEDDALGQVWTSGYQTLLQDVADAYAQVLTPGGVDNLAPVIVGRVFIPADPPDVPHAYYRLPQTQSQMSDKWAYVVSAVASTLVTSQNSRKQGHGT